MRLSEDVLARGQRTSGRWKKAAKKLTAAEHEGGTALEKSPREPRINEAVMSRMIRAESKWRRTGGGAPTAVDLETNSSMARPAVPVKPRPL